MLDADADGVFFGGYYPEGELLIKQLRGAGWKGTFVVPDGVKDNEFIEVGGAAAEGTIVTCPCVPGDRIKEFADAYRAQFNEEPGTYGPEAYDAANVFLAGIESGITDREEMNTFVSDYDGEGITKHVSFDDKGESAEIPICVLQGRERRVRRPRAVGLTRSAPTTAAGNQAFPAAVCEGQTGASCS